MSIEYLLDRIRSGTGFALVTEDLAIRAYTALLLEVKDQWDALYVFACANLVNAYVKSAASSSQFSKRYVFKDHLARIISNVVRKRIPGVSVYYTPEICYVSVAGLQFSFHNVPKTRALAQYAASNMNIEQEWKGLRLQPAAVLIMEWASKARASKGAEDLVG